MATGIPTLDADNVSLQTLREYWFKTLARLISEEQAASPHLGPHITKYKGFGTKLDGVILKEQQLDDAMVVADAKAYAADTILNKRFDDVTLAIHGGKQPNISLPKHQLYFGKLAPATAKRPILGSQLELAELWPPLLAKETEPAFVALQGPVGDAVKIGGVARQGVKDAYLDNSKFRNDGDRRKIFDEYNAMAMDLYGDLGALVLEHPELGLPSDFAESCFLHISRDPGPQTVEQVDQELAKLKAQTDKLLEKRAELVKEEEDQVAADAEAAQAEEEAAQAEQEEAEAKKKAKAAREKADKAKKNAKKKK